MPIQFPFSKWRRPRPRVRWMCVAGLCLAGMYTVGCAHVMAADPAKKDDKADKTEKDVGQRRQNEVGKNEELSFIQEKVVSQMSELEERMFRLSEALKSLEPENASRLLIGLKYAREELIQLQMKESQLALAKLRYNDALVEQKQLLTKLQRLEQLLLSPDLDFQLQLERLRLMKDLLRRLDAAIQEEEREKQATERTLDMSAQLPVVRARLATLRELIQRQTDHLAATKELIPSKESSSPVSDEVPADALFAIESVKAEQPLTGEAITALATNQRETRERTQPLETDAPLIQSAGEQMDVAVQQLSQGLPQGSLPAQNQALELLKQALAELQQIEQNLEAAQTAEKFQELQKDQAGNRKATDGISEMAVQLGDSGAATRNELIRASGSMSTAEGSFGGRNAAEAGESQAEALAALKSARELLAAEADKLANRLRAEIKKRTIEGLVQMLEGQVAIRQAIVRLQPKLAEGTRAIVNSVVSLSKNEAKLIAVGDGLTALVEETEFGIALPAALRSITEAMTEVKDHLAKAEASTDVITLEQQIEEDLEALLDAIKQLPSNNGSGNAGNAGANDRERQLNRLIAELKMVRMLQVRVNNDTLDVDKQRPAEVKSLATSLLQKIEHLQGRQEDVHDVTERLAEERGEELNQ